MCRKYAASTGFWNEEPEKKKPDYERSRQRGIDSFEETRMFSWFAAEESGKKIIRRLTSTVILLLKCSREDSMTKVSLLTYLTEVLLWCNPEI